MIEHSPRPIWQAGSLACRTYSFPQGRLFFYLVWRIGGMVMNKHPLGCRT